jgi:hypothetical protein
VSRLRHISTFWIVILALGLASCGGSSSKRSTVATSPGPTGSSGPRSAGGTPDRSPSTPDGDGARSSAPGGGAAFDRSGVKLSFLEKSFFGAKSQVVYFIARAGPPAVDQARACVGRYLRKAPSAYCFAFSSERALRFSGVSRGPPANMKRPCWSAYWGKPKDRRPIGSDTNPAASALHCPDTIG